MKKLLISSGIILVVLLLAFAPVSAAPPKPTPDVTITVLNLAPGSIIDLAVGESRTFDILITSNQPFVSAVAKVDMYYAGKGVFWKSSTDTYSQGTSALLHLTVIGKKSTAGFAAVCDWPSEGICWPAGVAPEAIAAGARFKGVNVGEYFPFAIRVH